MTTTYADFLAAKAQGFVGVGIDADKVAVLTEEVGEVARAFLDGDLLPQHRCPAAVTLPTRPTGGAP